MALLRTFQIHPTLRCNLRCLHCYSSSGPERATSLPVKALIRAIEAAAVEGFEALAVSGGEPLLYRDLPEILEAAGQARMLRSITTNGTLITATNVEMLCERVDFVALSIDGFEQTHDRLRGRAGAFDAVQQAAALLRAAGIEFGITFTLTHANVYEVPDVITWASDCGAALLQIQPLEVSGRATLEAADMAPDTRDAAIAYLFAAGADEGSLKIHFAMADREALARRIEGEAFLATSDPRRFADLVSPLVLEEDGTLVPLQHGFPRSFAIGNVLHGDLSTMARRWEDSTLERFRCVRDAVVRQASDDTGALPFFNWYEAMAVTARAATRSVARVS